jgi:hypothetical protein
MITAARRITKRAVSGVECIVRQEGPLFFAEISDTNGFDAMGRNWCEGSLRTTMDASRRLRWTFGELLGVTQGTDSQW